MKQRDNKSASNFSFQPFFWVVMACVLSVALPFTTRSQSLPGSPNLISGQTATQLPNGHWLLIGGESGGGGLKTASIWNPQTNNTTQLSATLNHGRAWHTATMLPDGMVLVLGGISSGQEIVAAAEVFDAETQRFTTLPSTGVTARARHSVTLLSDGHVLIAGGVGASGQALQSAELWDALNPASSALPLLSTPRRNHVSTLLPDGRVLLWGGTDSGGSPLSTGDLFDPATQRFSPLPSYPTNLLPQNGDGPILIATIPIDRSTDVPTESMISLRFSKPLKVETVNANTVTLQGPRGIEKILVVPAENGSLAFITPDALLLAGATYTITINGAVDRNGLPLPISGLTFTTQALPGGPPDGLKPPADELPSVPPPPPSSPGTPADPDLAWKGKLKDGKPHSDWQDLPPLQAAPGETALAGQVLNLRGMPLAKVKLELESEYSSSTVYTETDNTGRFLLTKIDSGWHELIIDGHKARRRLNVNSPNLGQQEDHGLFEYGLDIKKGESQVLPFTIWLPKIDTQHAVKIPQKPGTEFVVTSPKMPGLELRLPANGELIDRTGKLVNEVSLTQIPTDRTPFPLPQVDVPVYFTAQPGGAYVVNPGGIGARIYYPNRNNLLPGSRFAFWHYDPGYHGWYVYGLGTVPADGKQVVPDPGISIYEFTGGMYQGGCGIICGPPPCPAGRKCKAGDPVDLATGLFVYEKTDLTVADAVMPISLTRTYRPGDTTSRAFGMGASQPYDMYIVGQPYINLNLIMADGGGYFFKRITPGIGFLNENPVFEHTATESIWYKATIRWIGGWELVRKDGMRYYFPDSELAQRQTGAAVTRITDRNGNMTIIDRVFPGDIKRITSPSGRWIEFIYDTAHRVTQAKDNAGRTVNYQYDSSGRLFRVTDPNGGTNEYGYDTLNRMTTVKDARGIVYLTNEYDATGKVTKQTMVDGGTYLFNYTMNGSAITQTDVTDPRGKIRQVTFNTDRQIISDTLALGLPEEQVTTYNLEPLTNFLLSETDPLGRTTSYTYDSFANRTSMTRLFGTPEAVTTNYTYEPHYHQVQTITDPLLHTTRFNYDLEGNLISVTDPLNNTTSFVNNPTGQAASTTTPLNQTTQMVYDMGDLVAMSDPLGNVTNRLLDSAGRLINITDPKGNQTIYDYDPLSRLTKVTDPRSGPTSFSYDENGNLLSVLDAKTASGVTAYTYDNMDRLATRRDPLLKTENYQYDLAGNLTQFTDRKTQVANYTYDGLNRRTGVTYHDGSTTSYTYDKGNRLTQIVDSIAGTITRTYDGLDRLTSEQTPQGAVSYTYDAASRRATMTVPGQPVTNYTYDNGNRLTQITQGSQIVQFSYDNANRRTALTLPNNIRVEYGYDAASRVTSIVYKQNGTTVIGDLTYEYDKAGNRTKVGGSWARTGIPQPVTTTSYDAGNRQLTFDGKTLAYDDNGNLQSITDSNGTTLYSWNARNQLVGISGPTVNASFVYDGIGRRQKKAINGGLIEFLYDYMNSIQESANGSVISNVLASLAIDEVFTRTHAGATVDLLSDALGSTIALTGNSGNSETEYRYEPFGKESAVGTSSTNPFRFTGRESDDIELYYYRNRFYHPGIGRFISEDPLRFSIEGTGIDTSFCGNESDVGKLGQNLYSYVDNNPLSYGDPLGLDKKPLDCRPPANGILVGTTFCHKCRFIPPNNKAYEDALKMGGKCANCLSGFVANGMRIVPPSCSDCAWLGALLFLDRIDCDKPYTVNVHLIPNSGGGEKTSRLCECKGFPGR